LPEFFWSDGDSSEGVPHAPNDNAKTAKSNANKWRMNYLPFPYWRERTEFGPVAPSGYPSAWLLSMPRIWRAADERRAFLGSKSDSVFDIKLRNHLLSPFL
jgi:hypothetical protein